ncbi:MAG: PQQ-binding-like beta-propeller repeat protein [Acidobacteria bacterium]|nr:PQQ-binding-like beta-propeller repeat protein [Acidobacteriota bacterium]
MKIAGRIFRQLQVSIPLLCVCSSLSPADWPAFAHDPQRTGWATEETTITAQNVAGLELKWKTQVKNEPRFLNALTAPIVATDVDTPQGLKTFVYVAGSSNNFHALDTANGSVVWNREFASRVLPGKGFVQGTLFCPNAITATPAIDRGKGTVYAIAMDGRLFGMDLATGKDKFPPMPFVAPFAKMWSLNLIDGLIYTSLSQGCGDGAGGFYSIDINNPRRPIVRRLLLSTSITAGIWGRGGPVAGKNHRIYGLTADGKFDPSTGEYGSSMVAASLPELELADYFAPRDWQHINKYDLDMGSASPVWFTFGNYKLLAGGGKQGVVYLMDAGSLGGSDHQTPLFTTPLLGNDEQSFQMKGIWGALAFWRDEQDRAWVYVPMWGPPSRTGPKFPQTNGPTPHGSIMAFKIVLGPASKKPMLEPAWISGDFDLPDPPVIANGILFALSTGQNAKQNSKDRTQDTRGAILYALDAKTGKTLYQSGGAINGWVHFSGLAIAGGRIFAVDHDSWVYCFGPKEE